MSLVAFNRGWARIESDLHGPSLTLFCSGGLQRGDKTFVLHGAEALDKLRAVLNERLSGTGILADDDAELISLGGPWFVHLQGFADGDKATAIVTQGLDNLPLVGRKMIATVADLLNRAFEDKQQ